MKNFDIKISFWFSVYNSLLEPCVLSILYVYFEMNLMNEKYKKQGKLSTNFGKLGNFSNFLPVGGRLRRFEWTPQCWAQQLARGNWRRYKTIRLLRYKYLTHQILMIYQFEPLPLPVSYITIEESHQMHSYQTTSTPLI